jgi:hypothetical protein
MSQVLGLLDCWNSPCYGLFSLCMRFETYEPFISLIFNFFFSGCCKLWITETTDTELEGMGAQL